MTRIRKKETGWGEDVAPTRTRSCRSHGSPTHVLTAGRTPGTGRPQRSHLGRLFKCRSLGRPLIHYTRKCGVWACLRTSGETKDERNSPLRRSREQTLLLKQKRGAFLSWGHGDGAGRLLSENWSVCGAQKSWGQTDLALSLTNH